MIRRDEAIGGSGNAAGNPRSYCWLAYFGWRFIPGLGGPVAILARHNGVSLLVIVHRSRKDQGLSRDSTYVLEDMLFVGIRQGG